DPRESVLAEHTAFVEDKQQTEFGLAQQDQLPHRFFVDIANAQQRAALGDLAAAVVIILEFAAPIGLVQIFLIGGFGASMSQKKAIGKNTVIAKTKGRVA